jgi:MarR family transcriptional regulator, organic hydroperoxide resistance regulator
MTDEQDDLAENLLDVLPRLLKRLKAELPAAAENPAEDTQWNRLAELRGTTGQVALLGILARQDRATMQDLAAQMAVTPATVTAMVKRLLIQGYVTRQSDESDWRVVWVQSTEAGRQVINYYNHRRRETLQRRLDRLSSTERQHLQAALPALRQLGEEEH